MASFLSKIVSSIRSGITRLTGLFAKPSPPSFSFDSSVTDFFDSVEEIIEDIFEEQIEPEEVAGWYFSGLNYEKDLGLEIFGNYTVDEAEDVLREYARLNLLHYNDNFYGIAEIQWNGEELDEIIEVNL